VKKVTTFSFEERYWGLKPEELEKIPFEEYCRKIFDPKMTYKKPEALKGWRHLSQTMYILSPHVGATLAEYGAHVIKFEMPRLADPMRHTSPFNEAYYYPLTDTRPYTGTGWGYVHANRNEDFITIDYHHPEAKEIVRTLWKISDSLAECYRPGTFNRWGIGYPQVLEVNPKLIYCWLGGFGGVGPGRRRGSYDILGQSIGGLAHSTGQHEDVIKVGDRYEKRYLQGGYPAKHTNWTIDWVSGLHCVCGLVAAGYWRRKSGLGTMIDLSQVSWANRQTRFGAQLYGRFGVVRQRWGNWDEVLCVHGIIITGKSDFPDSDNPQERDEARYVMVSAFKDPDFKDLCYLINRPDLWEKYKDTKERLKPESQMEIYGALELWAKDKSRSEVVKIINDAGLLALPVMSARDCFDYSHYWERGTLTFMNDPIYGDFMQAIGVLMSHTPPRAKWEARPLGADNVKIYHELLGFSMEKIKELYAKAVI
jgi:crotonobetainyl-CoA:carnitine CoA-transferase CaiB-like acyl-CoA transferase